LLFSTGYMANLAVMTTLAGRGEHVLLDRLSHASLIDGGLLSGARFRRYAHADARDAESALAAHAENASVVATDGVFSMDGDVGPLDALARVSRSHDAWLVVDDAHGLGIWIVWGLCCWFERVDRAFDAESAVIHLHNGAPATGSGSIAQSAADRPAGTMASGKGACAYGAVSGRGGANGHTTDGSAATIDAYSTRVAWKLRSSTSGAAGVTQGWILCGRDPPAYRTPGQRAATCDPFGCTYGGSGG
jgi:hypothetical protein